MNNNIHSNTISEKFYQYTAQISENFQKFSIQQNVNDALAVTVIGNGCLHTLIGEATNYFQPITKRTWEPIIFGCTLIAAANFIFFTKVKTALPQHYQILLSALSVVGYLNAQCRILKDIIDLQNSNDKLEQIKRDNNNPDIPPEFIKE